MNPDRSSVEPTTVSPNTSAPEGSGAGITVGSLDAVQTEQPLPDALPNNPSYNSSRANHRGPLRWALIGLIACLVVGIGALIFLRQSHHTKSELQAGSFSTVRLPLASLAPAQDHFNLADGVQINGSLSVDGSLTLKPISQPANPEAGQLYYDKLSNSLLLYNGHQFQSVGAGSSTVINNFGNVVSNVTNILSGNGNGVQLQPTSPGTAQNGNFNIAGTGIVGTLQTTIVSSNGGSLFINPTSISTASVPAGTPITAGNTGSVGSPDGPGWQNGLDANKVTVGETGGKLQSLSVYFIGGSSSSHVQLGLYSDDGDVPSHPSGLLASSQIVNLVPNGWTTAALPAVTVNPNTTYWLVVNTDDTTVERPYIGGSQTYCYVYSVFGNMPNPFSNGGCFGGDRNYSLYMTYLTNPSASGDVSVAQATFNQDGSVLLRNTQDSNTAFQIQNALGSSTLFNVDTINGRVSIGKADALYKLDIAGGDINLSTGHSVRFGGLPVLTTTNAGVVALSSMTVGGSVRVQADSFSVQDMGATHKNLNIDSNGAAVFSNKTDSTAGLQVQNAAGANVLTVDTTNNQIVLGNDGTSSTVSVAGIRGGNVTGNNQSGKNLEISAGNGTGTGGSGDIVFKTASGLSNPQVTVDGTSGAEAYSGASTSLSWTHVTGNHPDRLLLVTANAVSLTGPAAVTGVTYDGTPLTKLTEATATYAKGSVWYLLNPATGSHVITVTYAGSSDGVGAESTTFYNTDQSDPVGGFTSTTIDPGNTVMTTLSGTNPGQGVFAALLARQDFGAITPGAGQTELYEERTTNVNAGSFKTGNAGSTTMSWSGDGVGGSVNNVVVALNPEPNVQPDPLSEAFRITQSGTVGIALSSSENAVASISLGGSADRSIIVNQNPATGAGHNLTIAAGGGAIGNNNGGDLILQGGTSTGSGTSGSVIVRPTSNTSLAFQVQNADSSATVLSVDTASKTVRVVNLAVSGHIVTSGSTPNYAAGAAACTAPTVTITGTDTAGSISLTTGTGCSSNGVLLTLTFATAFGSAPHIVLTPATSATLGLGTYADATATTATIGTNSTPTSSTTYKWNYVVLQ